MAVLGKTTAFQEAFFFIPHAKMSTRRQLAKKLNNINKLKNFYFGNDFSTLGIKPNPLFSFPNQLIQSTISTSKLLHSSTPEVIP